MANGPVDEWRQVIVSEGTGQLPLNVSTVSDLWALRFKVEGGTGYSVSLAPSKALVLTDLEVGNGVQPSLTLTNWGDPQALRVKAVDLAGRPVDLQSGDVNLTCSAQGEWYDLGVLPSSFERDIIVTPGQQVRYPVSVTVEDEAGTPTYAVLTGAPESAPIGQVNYYGLTPTTNYTCTPTAIANATKMVITAISGPVDYALYNLTDGILFPSGSGTLSAKGAQVTINSLTDNRAWKLATSKPVQAYMGYDCSGTLPGTMFYLADGGLLNYGTDFTVPFANWETTGTVRLQYWVFATGAGTVTISTLAGTPVADPSNPYHFTAAGGWQIPLTNISRNTVYTINFVPDVVGSGAQIAVEQSSQNAATDVPATTPGRECLHRHQRGPHLFRQHPAVGRRCPHRRLPLRRNSREPRHHHGLSPALGNAGYNLLEFADWSLGSERRSGRGIISDREHRQRGDSCGIPRGRNQHLGPWRRRLLPPRRRNGCPRRRNALRGHGFRGPRWH